MPKTVRRIVSGARVAFDPRSTAEALVKRDMTNYKTEQEPQRAARWRKRQAEKSK